MDTTILEPLAVSIPEAAKALALSRSSLYRLMADGQLRAIRAHGRTLIAMEELKRFLASCPTTHSPAA